MFWTVKVMCNCFQTGNPRWNSLEAPDSMLYPWDVKSTYIKHPPFFETMVSMYGMWKASFYPKINGECFFNLFFVQGRLVYLSHV